MLFQMKQYIFLLLIPFKIDISENQSSLVQFFDRKS